MSVRGVGKVLQLITLGEVGGAQRVCGWTALGLRRAGYEVEVACGPGGWLEGWLGPYGVKVIPLTHMRREVSLEADLMAVRELVHLIRRGSYDVVHCHSSKAGILGRLAARIAGVPSLFTAHGWAFSEGVGARRRVLAVALEKVVGAGTARIICVSEYDYRLALRYRIAPAERVRVIYNGIEDVSEGLIARPGQGGGCHIVMVARFAAQKDFATLISASARLRGDFMLWLVGDGPLLAEAQGLAARLNLGGRVRFWGAREDVAEILAQAQVGVLCSNWEGLPISILEMMRAGLPVVATAVGGVPELVQDGENGFLVPRKDPVAVAVALQRLIDNPDLRAEMGAQSRAKFLARFCLKRMVEQILEVYAEVLGQG